MTTPMEDQLADVFAEDADRAPDIGPIAQRARSQVRRRIYGAATLMTTAAAIAVAGVLSVGSDPTELTDSNPSEAATIETTTRSGPLRGFGDNRCLETYSDDAITRRTFAFDGTVASIGPARSEPPGAELGLVAVTFEVNEWFIGDGKATVNVDMPEPDLRSGAEAETPPAKYEVGTRLLVSGEPQWGGTPRERAIATGCGFTRYYDDVTAAAWRAVGAANKGSA